MKKCMYLLAIAMMIVACQTNNDMNTPFKEGQKVVLRARLAADNTSAKQLPGKQRVAGQDNGADIKLTWNTGDQIKVTVDGQDAVFTLIGEGGSAEGEFEGTMPADGNNYIVSYPVDYDESKLANQTYVENGFGNGLLQMAGSGTLDEGFTLTATNAVLGLSLKGSGKVGKIVITNKNNSTTYTLNCEGTTLSSSEKLFYIVVPAGSWKFKAEVYDDHSPKPTETFEPRNATTFTAGGAVAMPAQKALLAYDLKTLTFEDDSFTEYTLDYCGANITTWSDLIDTEQAGGALLYNYWSGMSEPYWWHDDNNTQLKHEMPDYGEYSYMYGGMAVSNYAKEDYSFGHMMEGYLHQLEVYGAGGKSGANFVMCNSGFSTSDEVDVDATVPTLTFEDEQARFIDHMYVNNGTYALSGFESEFSDDDWLKVVAVGLYGGEETDRAEILLYDGTSHIVTEWTKWDLSSLGKVEEVKFYVISSQSSTSGSPYGAYCFAYDDVAVRFPKE